MSGSDDTIIDDIYHDACWQKMLAGVRAGEELELSRLQRIVCGDATTPTVERYGESWLTSFIDYCERGGIASLRARSDGTYTLVLADPLPTRTQAWKRIAAGYPELVPPGKSAGSS